MQQGLVAPASDATQSSGLSDATPQGRAKFGPSQRQSSVTMREHSSLLSPRAGPNLAPCRRFHLAEI